MGRVYWRGEGFRAAGAWARRTLISVLFRCRTPSSPFAPSPPQQPLIDLELDAEGLVAPRTSALLTSVVNVLKERCLLFFC